MPDKKLNWVDNEYSLEGQCNIEYCCFDVCYIMFHLFTGLTLGHVFLFEGRAVK